MSGARFVPLLIVAACSSSAPGPGAIPDAGSDAPECQTPVAPAPGPPPSCAGGLDCQGRSCCESRLVPGGSFSMGRSETGTDAYDTRSCDACGRDQPEHPATVRDFYLDTFEVTVARFRPFVDQYDGTPPAAGSGAHPGVCNSGWQTSWNVMLPASRDELLKALEVYDGCNCSNYTEQPGTRENEPVNTVGWFIGYAFCIWDGGRLPSEAEWEYAAAGGDENRLFPWGNQPPDATLAVFGHAEGDPPHARVGSVPAGVSRWGQFDMAGSVWESCRDGFINTWYLTQPSCDNCIDLSLGGSGMHRGGGWTSPPVEMRAANRHGYFFGRPSLVGGIRCARDADQNVP